MSKEPQTRTLNQTPKAVIITFEYKRTGMRGLRDTILISFKSGKIIKSRLHTSRSGHHGTRQYTLLPAKYLMYDVYRSNLGNIYIDLKVIEVNESGEIKSLREWSLYEGKEQRMLLNDLPEGIRSMLLNNKDQLPLFDYVLNQDQTE